MAMIRNENNENCPPSSWDASVNGNSPFQGTVLNSTKYICDKLDLWRKARNTFVLLKKTNSAVQNVDKAWEFGARLELCHFNAKEIARTSIYAINMSECFNHNNNINRDSLAPSQWHSFLVRPLHHNLSLSPSPSQWVQPVAEGGDAMCIHVFHCFSVYSAGVLHVSSWSRRLFLCWDQLVASQNGDEDHDAPSAHKGGQWLATRIHPLGQTCGPKQSKLSKPNTYQ